MIPPPSGPHGEMQVTAGVQQVELEEQVDPAGHWSHDPAHDWLPAQTVPSVSELAHRQPLPQLSGENPQTSPDCVQTPATVATQTPLWQSWLQQSLSSLQSAPFAEQGSTQCPSWQNEPPAQQKSAVHSVPNGKQTPSQTNWSPGQQSSSP